jgi:hypothetical protein
MKSNSTHKSALIFLTALVVIAGVAGQVFGQKRHLPTGGRLAVVVDEHLSVLRAAPKLSARLVERLSRGRFLAIIGRSGDRNGLNFYRVRATRRKTGWIQSDAVVSVAQPADDQRLLRLIRGSEEFDRLARARIFLDTFPHSPLRPTVALLYGDAAEEAAEKLSRDAGRRLNAIEMSAGGAPEFSYFLNYNGLDRYNRQGVRFVLDRSAKRFHYDGAAWREIVRRYPQSPEAAEARERLARLAALAQN